MNLSKHFVFTCIIVSVASFPLDYDNIAEPRGFPGIPSVNALNFMKKYGYIEDSPSDSAALFTEEGLEDIIRTIQKFGAIEQTGKLDNATVKLMETPRCGVPDIIRSDKRQKRFILGPTGWNKRNITFFIANWPPTISQQDVAKNIMIALDTWGRYGRLTFTRIYDPSADIIVAFGSGYHGDRYPFDGPGSILAHAFFPYEMESFGGDIHFDNDEKWTTNYNEEDGVDFLTVAVHELGHSLGLSHSHIPSSVMFPYYSGNGPNINLDYDDILGMYELYIKRRLKDDDLPIEYPPQPTTEYYYEEDYETERPLTTHTPQTARTEASTWYNTYTSTQYNPYTSTQYNPYTSTQYNPYTSTRSPHESTVMYEGDVESVDDHKNHDPHHGVPPTNSPSLPDICAGKYDAVATIRDEIFIFKDEYLWRLRREFDLVPGYPIPIHQMFPKLPKEIKHIDAAYERPDGMIILFTGNKYWVYDGTYFIENSPRPISHYGFPPYLEYIDAVQLWAKNGKTYFYKGNQFWRYNETSKLMDPGYPKHMERWRGVPVCLDAATTWRGVTYFFKDKCYWKFDNDWIIVTDKSPLPTPQMWLGCPKEEVEYCEPDGSLYAKIYRNIIGT